jgi:hypothetical protein
MRPGTRRLFWFVGLYLISAALFAAAVYGLRALLAFG